MKKITNYKENPFKPFARLNFYSFEDLELNNIDANTMEISSSTIDTSEFNNANFSSSSLLSTKFSSVLPFESTYFSNSTLWIDT